MGGFFCGGGILLGIDAVLNHARGHPFKKALWLTLVALASFILMCVFVAVGFAVVYSSEEDIDMSLMRTDFVAYCTGKPGSGSLHANGNFNIAALFEWTMCVIGSALVWLRLRPELSSWRTPTAPGTDAAAGLATA